MIIPPGIDLNFDNVKKYHDIAENEKEKLFQNIDSLNTQINSRTSKIQYYLGKDEPEEIQGLVWLVVE